MVDVVCRGTFLQVSPLGCTRSRRSRSEESGIPDRHRVEHLAQLWEEISKDNARHYFESGSSSPSSVKLVQTPATQTPTQSEDADQQDFTERIAGTGFEQECLWSVPPAEESSQSSLPERRRADPAVQSCTATSATVSEDEYTTVMLRNIPNKVNFPRLWEFLCETDIKGKFDVVHLPTDLKTGHNRGYAFVNLLDHDGYLLAMKALKGLKFPSNTSQKVTNVSVAHCQGKEAILAILEAQRETVAASAAGARQK